MSKGIVHGGSGSMTWETNGDRIIFNVPLIPDETTIVSWKKLLKVAKFKAGPDPSGLGRSLPEVPPSSSSVKTPLGEVGPSHLTCVIDKIGGMYGGGVGNDDEGFSVHHGKLEHIEPHESIVRHGKKRRHGDMLSESSPHGLNDSQTTMVEVAMEELAKAVSESTPHTNGVQDPDNPSQPSKRKLSPFIELKLAKVAELTVDTKGKFPKNVIDRLMGIVGHLIQVRALKRNLRAMADDMRRVLEIKGEVARMIEQRFPKSITEVKQHKLGKPLEDKIYDLYELFLERPYDTSRSLIRVYNELASLWPAGSMNFDRIRRAIDRAKRRRV